MSEDPQRMFIVWDAVLHDLWETQDPMKQARSASALMEMASRFTAELRKVRNSGICRERTDRGTSAGSIGTSLGLSKTQVQDILRHDSEEPESLRRKGT